MSTNSIPANKKLTQLPLASKNGSFSTNFGTGDSTNNPAINPSKVLSILSGLKAITHAYTDSEDRIIKIWKSHTFGYLADW